MEKSELTEKLFELERQVQSLKDELVPAKRASGWQRFSKRVGRISRWLAAHWFLITFSFALMTAVYVKYVYGIAYLEDYRNAATTRKLSEFYRKLGDDMLSDFEYQEAVNAYQSSLALDKNNELAAQGMVKARVYIPLEGQKYVPAELVDYKLHHLMRLFPNDPHLLLMKSALEYNRNNPDEAIRLAELAIKAKPDFGSAYAEMGFYYQIGGIEQAIKNYEKALEYNPESSAAELNLGLCRMLATDFPKAIELLSKSKTTMPRLLTVFLLGDAYRYNRQFAEARQQHEEAKGVLAGAKDEDLIELRYLEPPWILNYMPKTKGDTATINDGVKVYGYQYMKSLLYYSLSFDYAVAGDFAQADAEFADAAKVPTPDVLKVYLGSHITYMRNNLELTPAARAWLDKKAKTLGQ